MSFFATQIDSSKITTAYAHCSENSVLARFFRIMAVIGARKVAGVSIIAQLFENFVLLSILLF